MSARTAHVVTAAPARKIPPPTPIPTLLNHAATWLRVLDGCAHRPLEVADAETRRVIIDAALEAVEAWGTPAMREEGRALAARGRDLADLADVARPSAPVIDLATFREARARKAAS